MKKVISTLFLIMLVAAVYANEGDKILKGFGLGLFIMGAACVGLVAMLVWIIVLIFGKHKD